MSTYTPRHAARATRPGRTSRRFLTVIFLTIVTGATGNAMTTATAPRLPGHGQFHADATLDTSQVQWGAPIPACGSPADRPDRACAVPSPEGTLIAETDGTTFLIPTPEG